MIAVEARLQLRTFVLDVATAFRPGVTVLRGPSGAGKSTLLRIVAGLVRPDSGRVEIGGRVVEDRARFVPPFRREIGFVFQEYALFPHLDVLANVGFGLAARRVPRAERERRARAWLERLGLEALERARPGGLSGGERQRVAVARALATEPRAVLLDEPFAALDPVSRERTREAVHAALSALDVPVVLVTHDESDVRAFDAPVVRMESGRLAR